MKFLASARGYNNKLSLFDLQIRNGDGVTCIDGESPKNHEHVPVKAWPCHNQGGNQVS